MQSNTTNREQRLLAAIDAYTEHVVRGGDPRVLQWIINHVEDASLWYALIDLLTVMCTLGTTNVDAAMLTPSERRLLEAAIARALEQNGSSTHEQPDWAAREHQSAGPRGGSERRS